MRTCHHRLYGGTHFIEVTDPRPADGSLLLRRKSAGEVHLHHGIWILTGSSMRFVMKDKFPWVIDIRQMPDTAFVSSTATTNLVNRSHNIEIDTSQGMLYTFATSGEEARGQVSAACL